MTFSLSRMASAVKSSKDSAQSPAWSRKARPAATWASADRSRRASPANTSGGSTDSAFRLVSSAAGSGQSGCCPAGRSRHELGVHTVSTPYSVVRTDAEHKAVSRRSGRDRSVRRPAAWPHRAGIDPSGGPPRPAAPGRARPPTTGAGHPPGRPRPPTTERAPTRLAAADARP